MSELDPFDKRLNTAWQALSPPVDLAARVRARLASTGGAAAATTLGARAASRWRALRASGPLGAGAGALLLGVGIALGYLIPREPVDTASTPEPGAPVRAEAPPLPPSTPPVSSAPAIPAAATEAGTSPSDAASPAPDSPVPGSPVPDSSALAPAPRRQAAPPPRTRAHLAGPAPLAKSDPGAELSLLERAERAVRSRNPALALALIAELEQGFPRSPLHEERRSIELMAHCQARGGDTSAATNPEVSARLERFRQQYPESVYSSRIADECSSEAPGSSAHSEAPLTTRPTNSTTPDIDGAEGGDDVQED